MHSDPAWTHVFEVQDANGVALTDQGLPLTQVSDTEFAFGATLHYRGPTGLDPALDADVRTLPLNRGRLSDLASVPAIVRWFVRPYGAHTPAALFHDRFVDADSPISHVDADRYFLAMLRALHVPTVKRLIMWAAVALNTRWQTNKALLIFWILLSATGLGFFIAAAIGLGLPAWTGGRWPVLIVTTLAPLPASLIWGAQRGAALIAAVAAIWMLPASLLALMALGVYQVFEFLARQV